MLDSELRAGPAIRATSRPRFASGLHGWPTCGACGVRRPTITTGATISGGPMRLERARPEAPGSVDPRQNVVQELSSDKFDRLYFGAKYVGNIVPCRGGDRRTNISTRGSTLSAESARIGSAAAHRLALAPTSSSTYPALIQAGVTATAQAGVTDRSPVLAVSPHKSIAAKFSHGGLDKSRVGRRAF